MRAAMIRLIASVLATDNLGNITAWVIPAISAHNRRVQMAEVRWSQDVNTVVMNIVWMPIANVRVVKHLANTIA
jgi:hypothetical protein